MRPMTYTVDTQKIRSAFVPCAQGLLMGAILAMLGATLNDLAPDDGPGVFFFLVALVLLLASVVFAVQLSRRLPVAKNLLSVDRHGLTHMRRGRVRRWRWADISPVRLQGRFASFTAEAGGGRSEGRIDDIYPTPLTEIVARINNYRDRASAAGGAALDTEAPVADPSPPTMYYIDPATQKVRRRKEILTSLFALILFLLIYILLGRDTFSDLLNETISLDLYLGILFAFLFIFTSLSLFFVTGKAGNFLQLTDEGLTWSRRLTLIRQWRWQDVSSFEIRESGVQRSGARAIVFMAADDGKLFRGMGLSSLLWTRSASPGLLSFTIDDSYDTPADQIAARLNACRDRALADAPPSRTIELSAAAMAGSGRQPLGFQKDMQDMQRLGVVGWALLIGCFVWLPAVLVLGWPFEVPGGMDGPAVSAWQWLLRFLSMLPMIAIIAEILFLIREIMPADNALTLDEYGLTLTRGGRKKLWAWRDLSAFKVEARRVLGLFGPRGVIVFDAPGGRDLRSRFLRLCYRLAGRSPAIVIENIYSAPLGDIATALNRYRAQGAGGGSTRAAG